MELKSNSPALVGWDFPVTLVMTLHLIFISKIISKESTRFVSDETSLQTLACVFAGMFFFLLLALLQGKIIHSVPTAGNQCPSGSILEC